MVLDYFKLAEQPFGVTPDPRFLYLGSTHREALASALYGVSAGRGFTALIAKPGMGKTTLLFDFLQKVRNHARTVFLFQSQSSPQDLLRSLLADLGIDDEGGDFVRMHRRLNELLLSESNRGKRLIVIIDEAQNLPDSVLELVRMLSNFETPREKLMHLILAGQPQLAERLASPSLVQLRQRVSMIARLKPFNAEETQLYIDHRLRVAGYEFATPMFTKRAQAMIASYAEGIPRNINNICFNAMSLGFVGKQETIDVEVVREVVDDLDIRSVIVESEAYAKPPMPNPVVPHLSGELPRSWQRSWSLRLAMILTVVAAMSTLLIRTRQHTSTALASAVSRNITAPAAPPVPSVASPIPDQLAVSDPVENVKPTIDSKLIVVLPGETLYRICIKNLGEYDDQVLMRIRELNPWLSDPDQIESGHKLRIPTDAEFQEKGSTIGPEKP